MIDVTNWTLEDYDIDVSGKGDSEGYFSSLVLGKTLYFTVSVDRDGYGHVCAANFADGPDLDLDRLSFKGRTFEDAVDMVIDCVCEHCDDNDDENA